MKPALTTAHAGRVKHNHQFGKMNFMFKSYVHHPKLFAYLLPGPIWAIGMMVASMRVFPQSEYAMIVAFFLGYLSIAYATFAWGNLRGYPVKTAEGAISITNILRCSVMSAIMVIPASIIAFPFLLGTAAIIK